MGNPAATPKPRFYYLDNLRIAVTALVIMHHVGQAYGPTGGWWPIQETARAPLLGPFFSVNRSFFMSLFFMISGYLLVMAYERSQAWPFARNRLMRLGLPALAFGLMMAPLEFFVFSPGAAWTGLNTGHLWYVVHLLVLSLIYVAWRQLYKRPAPEGLEQSRLPGTWAIAGFALALAVTSGVVRIWYPIDRWVYLLGLIRTAPADVPRDVSFFILGALAYRRQWFQRFPSRAGRAWLAVGLGLAALMYIYQLWLDRFLPLDGIAWGIVYDNWESFLCFGMCFGLVVLFRDRLNFQTPLSKALAQGQYATYVFHVPIVLGVQFLVLGLALPPLVKFGVVSAVAVPLAFLAGYAARKIL